MKKFYVTGSLEYEREITFRERTTKRVIIASFDRFVEAESAAEAMETVTEKVKKKHEKTNVGKINWVKINKIRVFELVIEQEA